MSRGLSPAAASAVAQEVVTRTVAISLDFPSGFVRINGSPADLNIGGNVYTGVGGLGAISVVQESSELRSYDLTVQLSGVPRDSVAIAMTQAYQGRAGIVYEVPLNSTTWQPIADPIVVFRGRMDQMDIALGTTATVSVKLINRLADWERPRVRRFTDEDQQRAHPGDKFFQFLPSTVEKQLIWPTRGWWDRNR